MITTKEQYESLFSAIRKILNDIDPPGLVKGGAPEDEYDAEIAKIMPLVDKISDADLLGQKLREIFSLSLGDDISGELSQYKMIAEEILKAYSKIDNINK